VPGDPHLRATPTVTGARLNLAPSEVATDRVIDLTRQLDLLMGHNRELVNRIKDLEAAGVTREQAMAEALREVDAAGAEVLRTRALLQSLRNENVALQQRIQQIEEEDIRTLKAVIAALERILTPPVRREP
jgi:hypothetical protein